jgi:hypothetical protein
MIGSGTLTKESPAIWRTPDLMHSMTMRCYGSAGPIRLAFERAEVNFTQETAVGISRARCFLGARRLDISSLPSGFCCPKKRRTS